jgi:hypothetical protein
MAPNIKSANDIRRVQLGKVRMDLGSWIEWNGFFITFDVIVAERCTRAAQGVVRMAITEIASRNVKIFFGTSSYRFSLQAERPRCVRIVQKSLVRPLSLKSDTAQIF